jgi:beta-galactosidase
MERKHSSKLSLLLLSAALAACGGPPSASTAGDPTSLSDLVSAASADLTPPSAPSNLTWANDGMTVALSWSPSTDDVGVVGYDLLYGSFFLGTFSDTSLALIGFKAGTPYVFTVKARDAAGNLSVASNSTTVLLAAQQDSTPPSAPTGLRAVSVTDTRVTLSWTASTDDTGVVVYQIYSGTSIVGTAAASTSATITGLSPSTTYVFTATALDAASNVSQASAALSVTTQATVDTTPPSAPTGLTASNVTTTSVTLSWSASTDNVAVTGYTLYNGTAIAASTSGLSASVSGLSPGTTYGFTVVAKDAAGNTSPSSSTASVTTSSASQSISINVGGAATGTFIADADFSGGTTYSNTNAIDTSLVSSSVPAAVFQSERYGPFTYSIPGLTAGSPYIVTLYFAETYLSSAGARLFDVAINGANVLSGFDIYATAGAQNKAVAQSFNATADGSGQVSIAFTAGAVENPKVCGITVASGSLSTYALTIAPSTNGSTSPAAGTYRYTAGTAVTVSAAPANGFIFSAWNGAATGSTNPVTVIMNGDATLGASFVQSTVDNSSMVQAYDGSRGATFNDGWKFIRSDVSGAQQPSYSDSSWRSLSVPHDWSIELSFNQSSASGAGGGYLDGGVGWYRKTFTLGTSYAGKQILIDFDGVYMNSQVWINGTSLGTRPYGYSTFQYDLTPYVKTDGSSNVLAVRVNNNLPTSRWYSGSGIYRNVWLTVINPVHVAFNGVYVSTPTVNASSGSVSVATDLENKSTSSQSVTLKTTILDSSGSLVTSNTSSATSLSASGKSTVTQSLNVSNPRLWSPDSPNLYQVKVEVQVGGATVDTYLAPLGFRWFSFSSSSGMSFNGNYMKMHGTCNHHDLGALGAAFNTRAMERQLQSLKSIGINALRTSHNPPAPELLALADRLGFVVMDEAFDCWESGKTTNDYHLYFSQWAQTDIQDMVRRDRNHPSVTLWSIGNEIPSATTTTATNLRNWVRAIDSSRPVTWNTMDVGGSVQGVLDLQEFSYNSYQYDSVHSAHSDWKIFNSESSSAVRSRGIYKTPTSTNILSGSDNQCSSYDNSVVSWGASAENAYKDDMNRNWILGQFIWTGFDYIGEPTPYSWPAKSSYFGIFDTAGIPKDIAYFYQSHWTTAPMVHVLPHWNYSSGTTVPVWVYTNCDSVELFLNNVSQGSKGMTSSTMHLEWSVSWSSGTLRADCKRNGSVVASDTVKTAGSAAQLKLTPDRTTITADGRDLVYVTAEVQDSSGVVVPTASNGVTFAVSGPGKIVGVDNGNAIDTTSYKSLSRNAFSGKLMAIVQSTGTAGQITVTATSSGLTQGSASATAQ